MAWTRTYTTRTTASPEAVWKRHVTPEDWAVDDPMTISAEFPTPPRTGDTGTITSRAGTRRFVFTEVRPYESMTQVMRLPGGRLTLGHELVVEEHALRVTHSVRLEGPLAVLLIPLVGLPIVRSRPEVVGGTLSRALAAHDTTPRS